MKETYSWLTFSCLIFGFGILCDENPDRRQAGSSCSVTSTEPLFRCSDGLCIAWSSVCDGRNDCLDNSDENKELCARYEYGTNNTRECGRVYNTDHSASSINGKKELVGTAPWNVVIYRLNKETSNYNMTCLGTIIDPRLIVSAAQCFWHSPLMNNTILRNVDLFKVAVGKYNSDSAVTRYEYPEILNMEHIYLDGDISEESQFSNKNIAVIVLSTRITFNSVVSPVCIDWSGKYNVHHGAQGKVISYKTKENGGIDTVLMEEPFTYIGLKTCRKKYESEKQWLTDDMLCAGFALGEVGGNISGLGSTILHSGSYYLTGVLVYKFSFSEKLYPVAAFTNVEHNQLIRGLINRLKNLDSKFCVLPSVEGVLYSNEDSNTILAHGEIINQYRTVIENCDVGYHKAYPNGFRICGENGKWISTSEKLCYKMCPPLLSESLDIKCTLNGKFANCSNPSIAETIAILSCKPTFIKPIGLENTSSELICQSNGEWNNQLYKCDPYCGIVYSHINTTMTNGEIAVVGTAPWNVGIYRLNKYTFKHDYICGGSIIAPNIIISAAHCFWYKGIISINNNLYKVAVGKYDKDITPHDNEFTKIMNVRMIYLNDDYSAKDHQFSHDIAIIVLSENIYFSNDVAPICIDWNSEYNVSNGVKGKTVGWGKMENGTLSPVLLETSLPYIDHNSCLDMYTDGFEKFVTYDKFCAGSALVSGQHLDEGDSGSGLAILHSASYYLTGVLSVKESSVNNSIALFTEIKYHIKWIQGLYNKHEKL